MATKPLRGIEGLNRMMRDLPKEVQARIKDASIAIASDVANEARGRALSGAGGRVSRYVAPTIRGGQAREPIIRMGGRTSLPSRDGRPRTGSRQTVGDIMWGAEFGSAQHKQFQPWGGNGTSAGYFLWPSIRMDDILERWAEATEDAMRTA
jgi:hypothetical protein